MSPLRDYVESIYGRIREIPNRIDGFLLESFNYAIEEYGDPSLREVYLEDFEKNKEYFLGLLCSLSVGFSPIPLPFPHGVITRPIIIMHLRERYERNHPNEKNLHSYLIAAGSFLPFIGPWLYTIPLFINGRKVFPILSRWFWDNKKELIEGLKKP